MQKDISFQSQVWKRRELIRHKDQNSTPDSTQIPHQVIYNFKNNSSTMLSKYLETRTNLEHTNGMQSPKSIRGKKYDSDNQMTKKRGNVSDYKNQSSHNNLVEKRSLDQVHCRSQTQIQNQRLKKQNKDMREDLINLGEKYLRLKHHYNRRIKSQSTPYEKYKNQPIIHTSESKGDITVYNDRDHLLIEMKNLQKINSRLSKENTSLNQTVNQLTIRLQRLEHLDEKFQKLLRDYKHLQKSFVEDERMWKSQKNLWHKEVQNYQKVIKQLQRCLEHKKERQY